MRWRQRDCRGLRRAPIRSPVRYPAAHDSASWTQDLGRPPRRSVQAHV